MLAFMKLFGVSAVAFVALDFVWLNLIMKSFITAQLAEVGRYKDGELDALPVPALLGYLLMASSLVYFVMPKVGAKDPLWKVFLTGAAMGLVVYGFFQLTNTALLKNYPFAFAMADMAWGTFAYGAVSIITKAVRDR